jgi:hypothetical protein
MLGLLNTGSGKDCKGSKLDIPRPIFITQGVSSRRDVVYIMEIYNNLLSVESSQ